MSGMGSPWGLARTTPSALKHREGTESQGRRRGTGADNGLKLVNVWKAFLLLAGKPSPCSSTGCPGIGIHPGNENREGQQQQQPEDFEHSVPPLENLTHYSDFLISL